MEETYSTDGPICPYCEHQHNPADEPQHYYNEMADESTCSSCGKDFKLSVYVRHSWTCEAYE